MNIFKKSHIIGALSIILAASSLGALAGEVPGHSQMSFATFDTDGNGWVSKKEFGQMLSKMKAGGAPANAPVPKFSDFDKNGDGKISKAELTAGH